MLCYGCLQQRVEALHAGQLLPGLRPPLKTGKECLEDLGFCGGGRVCAMAAFASSPTCPLPSLGGVMVRPKTHSRLALSGQAPSFQL